MGGGGHNALDGGQLFRHEQGQLLQGAGLQHDHQVVAAAHQIYAGDLVKTVYLLRNRIETTIAHGSDAHFDKRLNLVDVDLFPVDERGVFDDDELLFEMGDGVRHLCMGLAQHHRDLADRGARVVGKYVKNGKLKTSHRENSSIILRIIEFCFCIFNLSPNKNNQYQILLLHIYFHQHMQLYVYHNKYI